MKSPSEIKKGCGMKNIQVCHLCNKQMTLIKEPEFMVWSCECGEEVDFDMEKNGDYVCGCFGYLCPTCQALLEQAIEFEKEIGDLKFLLGDITIERDYYKSCFEKQAQEFQKKINNFYEALRESIFEFNQNEFSHMELYKMLDREFKGFKELLKEVQDKPKYPNAFLGGYSEFQGEKE